MKPYTGSCHCGAVKFKANADVSKSIVCNCSHCHRKGLILTFIPAREFELEKGADDLTEYRFNKKVIQHQFCKHCGVQAFGRGKDQQGNDTVALNLRCLDGVDTDSLSPQKFNGKDY